MRAGGEIVETFSGHKFQLYLVLRRNTDLEHLYMVHYHSRLYNSKDYRTARFSCNLIDGYDCHIISVVQ